MISVKEVVRNDVKEGSSSGVSGTKYAKEHQGRNHPLDQSHSLKKYLTLKELVDEGCKNLKGARTYSEVSKVARDIAECAERILEMSMEEVEMMNDRRIHQAKPNYPQRRQPPSQQAYQQQNRPQMMRSFVEAASVSYSFSKDHVGTLFDALLEVGRLKLPAPKKPEEVHLTSHPKYCVYHQMLGHQIEDCFTFKNHLETLIKEGVVELKSEFRVDPPQPHQPSQPFRPRPTRNISTNMVSLGYLIDSLERKANKSHQTVRVNSEKK